MKDRLATKIIKLLIPWITPITFLLSAQIAYEFGMLGLLFFSFITALSFFIFFFVSNNHIPLKNDVNLKKAIYILFMTEVITCILLVVKKIILNFPMGYFSIFYYLSLITCLFVISYFRQKYRKWLSNSMVLLGLIASFLIPTIVYLKISIPTVYSGLYYLAKDMIEFNLSSIWTDFIAWGILIIVHQYLFYIYYIKKNISSYKGGPLLSASLICLISPISSGSLAFLAKAQVVWPEQIDTVSLMVIHIFGGTFGRAFFVIVSLFILINLLLKIKRSINLNFNNGLMTILKFLIVPVLVISLLDLTILDVLLFSGMFWGPLLSLVLLSGNLKIGLKSSYIIGVLTSFVATYLTTLTDGILLGCFTTGCILMFFKIIEYKHVT